MRQSAGKVGAWIVLLPGAVLAQQNTFDIRVSNPISPAHPSATVEVWAVWDPAQYAFNAAYFDILASPDPGAFTDPTTILVGPGAQDGFITPDGDEVDGMIVGQVHFPEAGLFANLDNPILVWQVTWGTTDFTPRNVGIVSLTSDFDLYINSDGYAKGFIDEFVEGSATITVVPAPACGAMLATAAAVGWRRRS